jgi:hypothetical protein
VAALFSRAVGEHGAVVLGHGRSIHRGAGATPNMYSMLPHKQNIVSPLRILPCNLYGVCNDGMLRAGKVQVSSRPGRGVVGEVAQDQPDCRYNYWRAPCFASEQHRFSVTSSCCRVLRKQQQHYRNVHKDTIVECPNPECDFYCTFADDDVNFQANSSAIVNGAEHQGVHGYLQQ